jgi:hypothetical protein
MKRFALTSPPARDKLLSYFFGLAAWIYVREHMPEPGDPSPHEIEWAAGERKQHRITYVDDHRGGVQFFAFTTDEPGKEAAIEQRLLNSPFGVMTRAQVMEKFRTADDSASLVRAFGKVAVSAPGAFDDESGKAVRRVLGDGDPAVRAAGLGLLTYMGWPELEPLVERLQGDPDPTVRKKAQIVLAAYRELPC